MYPKPRQGRLKMNIFLKNQDSYGLSGVSNFKLYVKNEEQSRQINFHSVQEMALSFIYV